METKNRQKILMITIGVIVGLLLANSIIVQPLRNAWSNGQTKIAKLRDQVEQDNHLILREEALKKRWAYIQQTALTNDTAAAQSALYKAIARWTQVSQVSIESLSPQLKDDLDDQSRETIQTLECRVDATGTITSVLRFLYEIETEKMGIKLDNIEIASKDNTGRTLTLSLTINALILGPNTASSAPVAAPQPSSESL